MQKLRKMELIELFLGFKSKKQRKTEQLKEKNGFHHANMLVTGEIIAKKDLESNTIKMATNLKACGLLIKDKDKELIGEMKIRNCVGIILVNGTRTKSKAEVHSFIKMEKDMMDTGLTANHREKVE